MPIIVDTQDIWGHDWVGSKRFTEQRASREVANPER